MEFITQNTARQESYYERMIGIMKSNWKKRRFLKEDDYNTLICEVHFQTIEIYYG